MIDKATVNLYGCCKCNHKWIAGWDISNNKESPIPNYCPKCKNFRWDQQYTKEEDSLFDQVHEQHTVKRIKEVSKYAQLMAKLKGQNADSKNHMVTIDYVDIIAYDFLYEISPQPVMFELRQLLDIPKKDIEARHELMLSVIRDRIDNADKYEIERFSKYGDSYLLHGNNKRFHGIDKPLGQPKRKSEKPIKGCKHTIQKVRKLEKLIDQRKEQNNRKVKKKWELDRQNFHQLTQKRESELIEKARQSGISVDVEAETLLRESFSHYLNAKTRNEKAQIISKYVETRNRIEREIEARGISATGINNP